MRKRKGFTLVEIMIVVGIIALLAAIAIPNLLRSRITSAEASAQATLKTISTAMESYASANSGNFPTSINNLTSANPPWMNQNYADNTPRNGYLFDCPAAVLDGTGYTCTATPTGTYAGKAKNYTISTGANLTQS